MTCRLIIASVNSNGGVESVGKKIIKFPDLVEEVDLSKYPENSHIIDIYKNGVMLYIKPIIKNVNGVQLKTYN
jgi:hypothetical protein